MIRHGLEKVLIRLISAETLVAFERLSQETYFLTSIFLDDKVHGALLCN